jgi:hypothetical protein
MRDLYRAERPSVGQPFGSEDHLGDLSSSDAESDPWVSDNDGVIYFSVFANGDANIYEARRAGL